LVDRVRVARRSGCRRRLRAPRLVESLLEAFQLIRALREIDERARQMG